MTSSKSTDVPSWWLVIGTIAGFLCSFIIAGHGGLPMALMLVIGIVQSLQESSVWLNPVVTWWICLILIAAGKFIERRGILTQIGVIGLFVSWVHFLWFGEAEVPETLSISIPFLISIGFWIRFWLLKFLSSRIEKRLHPN